MLSLDEAIKHCEEVAELNEECARVYNEQGETMASCSCKECAKEHRQLAEWLRELQRYRFEKSKELIQEYTNNGLMIADIFNITDTKNVKTSINEEQNLIEVCGDGFTMWFDIDWWDAPYEKDYIPKDILDKIRAEIEALEEGITSYYNDRPWIFKDEVLQIIDKYKAESEDKE